MADPLGPSAKDRTRGLVGTALILGVLALVLWFVATILFSEEQPITHEEMTVIGFGMSASYAGNSAVVRVRDAQGLEHPVSAPADIGESCEVGDTIAIQKQGIQLQVGVAGCGGSESTE